MVRKLMTICYDGTDYHGWQVQPNGITVQSVLQDALKNVIGVRPDVTGCSRTDAGVHAKMFCCHFDCDDSLPDNAFLLGLNSVLPPSIAVTDCKTVPDDFHARYNALGKTYVYNFYVGHKDPFCERYALRLINEPDTDKMNEFCKKIVGKHDFYGFSASGRTVTDTVRTVKECKVIKEDEKISFIITADGFLYNMVRILAGTALAVGQGRLSPECADRVFATRERKEGGDTLAARGLTLLKVYY